MASLNTTKLELQLEQVIALLREANDEYNWDPATFAVTVVIGAIATLLTVLAIGQGLLAAGPGRLKSGHYAVGPWSSTQETRFAWGEWRFRTTVATPTIRFCLTDEGWFRGNQHMDNVPATPSLIRRLQVKLKLRRFRVKSKFYSEYFPATWLKLLTMLRLDRPELWLAERLGVDYIPSDLPAAQAYGSIRDVSILTLMAAQGYAVVHQDSVNGLPFVQGISKSSITLSFRDHPLLGIAGSLSTFDTRDFWATAPGSRLFPGPAIIRIQHLLDYAFGRVALSGRAGTARLYGAVTFWDAFRPPQPSFWHCPIEWSNYRKKFYPTYTSGLTDSEFPGHGCICHSDPNRTAPSWQGPALEYNDVPRRDNQAAWHRLLALPMATAPKLPPVAFPKAGASLLGMLALFVTQSTTWNASISRRCPQPTPPTNMATLLERGPSQWIDTRQAGDTTSRPTLRLDEWVLHDCCQIMSDLMLPRKAEGSSPSLYVKHLECPDDPYRLWNTRLSFPYVRATIDRIDKWVLARQDTMSEWFRTACVMSEIARKIETLAQEKSLIRGNDPVTAAAEWESVKRKVLEYSSLKMNLHAKDISMALEALLGSWDFGEALPRPVDLPGYMLADLMVYKVVLIVIVLTGWSADSTILLDEKYERIVPIL